MLLSWSKAATTTSRAMLVLALLLGAASLVAAPRNVRLGFSDSDATNHMTVLWNTDTAGEPSFVQLGKGSSYPLEFEGIEFPSKGVIGIVHEVVLTDLEPDEEYHYRVGGEGGWSQDYTFRTLPVDPCAPLRLVFLGDGRSDGDEGSSPRWPPILGEALEGQPHVVLHSGDIVHDGDVAPQWRHHLDATGAQAGTPILYTLGNHDDDNVEGDDAMYNQVFAHPRNSVSDTEDYWYITFGDVVVVSLSTQTFKGGTSPFQEQADWLDQVLTETNKKWKFIYFHHPLFTASLDIGFADVGHPPNEAGQNPAFLPIIDKHHVDFVFYGHNHFYQRFKPMRGGSDLEKGEVVGGPEEGTYHVVTGGGGAFTYVVGMALMCGLTNGSDVCNGNHHFVEIDITGNDLTYRARQTKTQLVGTSDSNAQLIEEIVYTKAGVDECLVVTPDEPVIEIVEPDVDEPEVATETTPPVDTGPEAPDPECASNADCFGALAIDCPGGHPACVEGVCVVVCPDTVAVETAPETVPETVAEVPETDKDASPTTPDTGAGDDTSGGGSTPGGGDSGSSSDCSTSGFAGPAPLSSTLWLLGLLGFLALRLTRRRT